MNRDALASKLNAYGVLASMSLPVIVQIDRGGLPELDPDDRERLEYLREILGASWQGAKLKGELNPRLKLSPKPGGKAPTTSRKLADHKVVSEIAPTGDDFRKFVMQANKSLAAMLARPESLAARDLEFLRGPFRKFLEQLSSSSAPAASSRRMMAHRTSLA